MSHYIKNTEQKLPNVPEKFATNKSVVGAGKLLNLRNDAHLSEFLGCTAPIISKIRNGKFPVNNGLLIRIHEEIGMSVKN